LAIGAPGKAELEATTRSGWDHFYSSEYDEALSDFEKVWEARPDDANALNHVLDALIYRELYRYNALDTRLYSKQGFINSKQVPIDSLTKQRIKDLTDQSLMLSDKRLRLDPKDVQALYSRGVTEGLRSSYEVIVEHAWFSALRNALAARLLHDLQAAALQAGRGGERVRPGGLGRRRGGRQRRQDRQGQGQGKDQARPAARHGRAPVMMIAHKTKCLLIDIIGATAGLPVFSLLLMWTSRAARATCAASCPRSADRIY